MTDDAAGPSTWFHGTRAELRSGESLVAGHRSNYRPGIVMNHVYFTALLSGAALAAEVAVLLAGEGVPRVYEVQPTGPFEDDPNVTDKKLPGNPTRSYRTRDPLLVVREVADWQRLTPDDLRTWRDRLHRLLHDERAEIIN